MAKRDSLTELENFIDSYAADETDEDDDDGEDEQQKMVNLLKQQMMTNLTLMNTLKQNSAFPAAPRLPLVPGAALPNPLLQNLMLPNLIPNIASNLNLLQAANPVIPNLLGGAMANPQLLANAGKAAGLDPNKNPLGVNPALLNAMNPLFGKQAAGIPMLNPYSQIQPVPKKEGHIPAQPYPTVMIPGIGPCMMIPQENQKLEQNEKAAAELKKRLESVDSENRILTRKKSIDTSNFPKEILRKSSSGHGEPEYGGSRRRSSTKDDIKPESIIIRSKIGGKSSKESKKGEKEIRRVITIKDNTGESKTGSKERRKSKTLDKREIQTIAEEKLKRDRGEKVKGGHEVYVPPLRRSSSVDVNPIDKIVTDEISKPEKPIKSILKKPKEKSDDKSTDKLTNFKTEKTEKADNKKSDNENSGTDDESFKKKQREQKEVNNFVQILEKLGTDDDELQNIADLIIKKAIRKKSQIERLVLECSNLIEKKPLFRNIFLQNLQKSHQERKNVKKDNRENFIGLIMLLTEVYLSIQMSDGVSFMEILVQPIKQGIIELLNDAELNKNESQCLCELMVRLGPVLTDENPESLEIIMATVRAVSIHVSKLTPETRKYLLKLVELYAHCWEMPKQSFFN